MSEGIVHLIYTTNKSFFSLQLVNLDVVPNLPSECIDSLREIPKRPVPTDVIYKRSTRTPLIEETAFGGDGKVRDDKKQENE